MIFVFCFSITGFPKEYINIAVAQSSSNLNNFGSQKSIFTMLYGQVSIDPEVMSGAPVFAGTRVPIQNLFDYLENENLAEFLDDFPSVSKQAALNVLEMAKKSLTTEKVLHENFA